MDNVEQAVTCFKNGFSCAQAIAATYGPAYGVDRDTCLRAAAGFGAGMGRMGNVCGCVTGACIVLGLRHGSTNPGDRASKEHTHAMVRQFTERFTALHGSTICRELLGCDIGTPEGLKLAVDRGLFRTICPKLVEDAARILEEMHAGHEPGDTKPTPDRPAEH